MNRRRIELRVDPPGRFALAVVFATLLTSCRAGESTDVFAAMDDRQTEWRAYGGDVMGSRYSHLDEINRSNVQQLVVAWRHETGESDSAFATRKQPTLEATPIVVDGIMYFSTPLGRVIALDPDTGRELWVYDAAPSA
jgi:quinoprotein glucose dehydrogenase